MSRDKEGRFTKELTGEKNYKWKGNDVGYFGLHTWVVRRKGKAKVCIECGSSKWVQWANISKKYKRDESDRKSLCVVCHRRFDGITKLSLEDVAYIRKMYKSGQTQTSLAKEFSVCKGTISNIILHRIQYYG